MSEQVEGQANQVEQPQAISMEDFEQLRSTVEQLQLSKDRVLQESKEWKSKYQAAREEMETKEKEELEAKGDLAAMLEREKNEAAKYKQEAADMKRKTLKQTLHYEVARHAKDAHDIADVIHSLPTGMVQMDEESMMFSGVQEAIGKLRQDKPYLFNTGKTVGMADARPSADIREKTFEELSSNEQDALFIDALLKTRK